MTEGPLLWYANRGTGFVLLALFTAAVWIGVMSTRGDASRRIPRFLVQSVHRNVSLLAMLMLAVHIATATIDEYVDIRWWQAFSPFGATYQPLWLALGAVATDLLIAITLTSLVRNRLNHRFWRGLHLLTYASWALGLIHGLGIGTDSGEPWARYTYLACAGVVLLAVAIRLVGLMLGRRRGAPVVADLARMEAAR